MALAILFTRLRIRLTLLQNLGPVSNFGGLVCTSVVRANHQWPDEAQRCKGQNGDPSDFHGAVTLKKVTR
jgi:hypothetical protein